MTIQENNINVTVYNISYINDDPTAKIMDLIENYKKQNYLIKENFTTADIYGTYKTSLQLYEIEADNNKKILTLNYR